MFQIPFDVLSKRVLKHIKNSIGMPFAFLRDSHLQNNGNAFAVFHYIERAIEGVGAFFHFAAR